MKVYEVLIDQEHSPIYAGSLAAAKDIIRDHPDSARWPEVRVTECELRTDAAGIIGALNRAPQMERGREWRGYELSLPELSLSVQDLDS